MLRTPSERPGDRQRRRAVEQQLGGRQIARAELVLETQYGDALQALRGVAQLDEEERETLAAEPVALGSRQRQRDLRGDRGA